MNEQTGLKNAETRRQDAADRVQIAEMAKRTPGFPRPLQAEVDAAEGELNAATEECNRMHEELRDIDKELEDLH